MITIGLDVGRENDPAALAVLATVGTRPGSHRPAWRVLSVGNLELGTGYRDMAELAVELACGIRNDGHGVTLTIDTTGIGAAVAEHARAAPGADTLHLIDLTISAGRALSLHGPNKYVVGKHRLTEVLQVALQQHGLTIATQADPHGLAQQLEAFVAKPTATGYRKHEATGSGHDDLVLATELALWTGDTMHDQHAGITP